MGVLNVPKHTGMPSPAVMWDRMGVCVCVCVDGFDRGTAECGTLHNT